MHEKLAEGQGTTVSLAELLRALKATQPAGDDASRIDQIRVLEEIKSAAAAAQAQVTATFRASQAAQQRARGVPAERAERGVAAQVGLARRISPFHARRYVGWASVLTGELPGTFAQLHAGRIPEWRAMLVARETAWLSREHRAVVDSELAPRLEACGDQRTIGEVKKAAYRLDPDGYVDRLRAAERDRRVTLRPAPDVMCRLTALLPVAAGVSAYATLGRDADTLRAAGDPRSRGQVMADLLLERLTGQSPAGGVPVEVHLVMPADTLLTPRPAATAAATAPGRGTAAAAAPGRGTSAGRGTVAGDLAGAGPRAGDASGREPAHLDGYGPVPAPLARQWLLDPARTAPTWIRRLYTHPASGQLISMDTRRRLFTASQRQFLRLRDQTCRTPYCDAPIRHTDHLTPAAAGGQTSLANGQSLCQACNHDKQAPGWHARPSPDGAITLTTPTGHHYQSPPPHPPGTARHGPPGRHDLSIDYRWAA